MVIYRLGSVWSSVVYEKIRTYSFYQVAIFVIESPRIIVCIRQVDQSYTMCGIAGAPVAAYLKVDLARVYIGRINQIRETSPVKEAQFIIVDSMHADTADIVPTSGAVTDLWVHYYAYHT